MMGYEYGPIGFFGGIGMLLWWGIIIVALVLFIRWVVSQTAGGGERREKSALDILKERYAKGEINKEEFEQKKKDLQA